MNVKNLYIEITNQCNLNCNTCFNRSGYNKNRLELSCEDIQKAIETFIPYGLERIMLSGGEPTLHSEFSQILDLVDEYPDLTFGISTNGTVHNKKFVKHLNTKKNLTLQISLDGSCEKQNSIVRGEGNFHKAIEFANMINSPALKPRLKMVVSQNNCEDIIAFCNLALQLNFIPEFAFIHKSGNGSEKWENKRLSAQQKLKILQSLKAFNKQNNTDIFLPVCTDKCPYVTGDNVLSLKIKPDGSIQPCQLLDDTTYSLGNINKYEKVYFAKRLNTIIELACIRSKCDYGCTNCMVNKYCGKGCMAESIYLNNDPLGNDGNCEYRKLLFLNLTLKGLANIHE